VEEGKRELGLGMLVRWDDREFSDVVSHCIAWCFGGGLGLGYVHVGPVFGKERIPHIYAGREGMHFFRNYTKDLEDVM
jgi:hypothetical protein